MEKKIIKLKITKSVQSKVKIVFIIPKEIGRKLVKNLIITQIIEDCISKVYNQQRWIKLKIWKSFKLEEDGWR